MTLDDVDVLVELDADPEVMRYLTGGKPTPREQMARVVEQEIGHRWMAYEHTNGEFVGWFGLRRSTDDPPDCELGYRLRRAKWNQGFATEGSLALIDVAFTELAARRVWAETMTVNARSRAVMERCGLRYVRTFHSEWPEPIDGTELGDVEYELSREDWERRSP